MVRTPPFHGGNTGPNPVGNASFLPIYLVVEKVLDFADIVENNKNTIFGNTNYFINITEYLK